MLNQFIKKMIRFSGYELHRQGFCTDPKNIGIDDDKGFPKVLEYKLLGTEFKFWVINDEMFNEYNHDSIKNDAEFSELGNLIKKGDKILEVGTNHGFFFTFMSKLTGTTGYVLGLEPLTKNIIVAHSQIALNNICNSSTLLNVAASCNAENLHLTRPSHNASIVEGNTNNANEVKGITCDSLLDKHGAFDLIKIDVEGYEAKVLMGCKKLLERKPKLAIELHMPFLSRYNSDLNSIFDLINIDKYEGKMIFRKDKTKSYTFDPKLINNDIINLFLTPKLS